MTMTPGNTRDYIPRHGRAAGYVDPARRTRAEASRWRVLCCALSLTVLAGGCVHRAGQVDAANGSVVAAVPSVDRVTWRDGLGYTPEGWPQSLAGDLVRPDDDRVYPGVLVVHGGGWERGERDDTRELAERIARAGFVVFNISHRFAPAYTFPAPVHDLQQAVRWMRDHADDYGLDADRIGAWGYSSGAHLTTLLAGIDADDALDTPHGGADTRLQAVVGGGTPTDLRKFGGGRLVVQFMQGNRDEQPQAYAQASPVTYVDADHPPVFLYHGGLDWVVSSDHARDYFRALQAADVPSGLFIHRLRGHISMFVWDDAAVDAALAFLTRHLHGTS